MINTVEAQRLVEGRNQILFKIRNKLGPFGQLYSEILKPKSRLQTFEQFKKKKGSIETVLKSVGKTRQIVDRIGVVSRIAGPTTIVLEISMVAIVIQEANPNDRSLVASREIGGSVGAVGGGIGGMWAGCAAGSMLASPSLLIPIVGEISTGSSCFIGGILGGLGLGALGRKVGEVGGVVIHDTYILVSDFSWSSP